MVTDGETYYGLGIFFTTFGITGIAVAAFVWTAKGLFSHFLSRDIENHKRNLERATFEHQIRFQNLHMKRAEIIDELYGLIDKALLDLHIAIELSEIHSADSQNEIIERAYNGGKKLQEFFGRNKIYFSKSFCEQVQSFISRHYELTVKFIPVSKKFASDSTDSNEISENIKQWVKIRNELKEEAQPIKSKLEDEFRLLIGVKDLNTY